MGFFLFLSFLFLALALLYGVRWFQCHGLEYWNGVPAKQQLDRDFWMLLLCAAISTVLVVVGILI